MVINKKFSILQALPDLNSGGVEQGTLEINKYLASKGSSFYCCFKWWKNGRTS
jgi:hypothetical protein